MPVFRDRAQEKYEKCQLLKVFLIFYYIMFNRLTYIHENMRNRIAKSLWGGGGSLSSSIYKFTSFTGNLNYILHHHVVLWMGTAANGKGMMLPKCGSRPGLFCRFPSVE